MCDSSCILGYHGCERWGGDGCIWNVKTGNWPTEEGQAGSIERTPELTDWSCHGPPHLFQLTPLHPPPHAPDKPHYYELLLRLDSFTLDLEAMCVLWVCAGKYEAGFQNLASCLLQTLFTWRQCPYLKGTDSLVIELRTMYTGSSSTNASMHSWSKAMPEFDVNTPLTIQTTLNTLHYIILALFIFDVGIMCNYNNWLD